MRSPVSRGKEQRMQKEQLESMMKEPVPQKGISIISLCMVREERTLYGMGCFTGARQAVETVRPLLEFSDREMVVAMSLDVKLQPIAVEIVAIGGLTLCTVDISNLFKHAILSNANGVICFHNHPTGDPAPSEVDEIVTRRVEKAGTILGISLVDHIIIGRDRFYSFREEGKLAASVRAI